MLKLRFEGGEPRNTADDGLQVCPRQGVDLGAKAARVFGHAQKIADDLNLEPKLASAIEAKAKDWTEVVKTGRTHLQDATPLTVGQKLSGMISMRCLRERKFGDLIVDVLRVARCTENAVKKLVQQTSAMALAGVASLDHACHFQFRSLHLSGHTSVTLLRNERRITVRGQSEALRTT